MLNITIPAVDLEFYDEVNRKFIYVKRDAQPLRLEHSLVSLSKWESKWHKPFLTDDEKTKEETVDYIKCMTITQNVDPESYQYLTQKNIDDVNEYIKNPMTATTFTETPSKKRSREIITAEIIYYWMIALQIPPEYAKWHLNRLMTLIRVCEIKNQPPKKMSRSAIMKRNAALNEARKRKHNTQG